MHAFGEWRYTLDRDATAAAYARAPMGDAQRCGCAFCRNFIAVRNNVFPNEFRALLDSLGIDASKEAEVYHEGRLSPGNHCYGGWYHFVGALDRTGDFAPVSYSGGAIAYMCNASAPPLEALKGLPLVQVEFRLQQAPWLIEDEEPT